MKKKLLIDGMHCQNCVKGLEAVLTEDLEGVKVDEISLEEGYAIINLEKELDEIELKGAVEELGFDLKAIEEA